MHRNSPPLRTTVHLCTGIRPRCAPRCIYAPVFAPADAHHGDFHHAKQLLGMVFFMDAASVGANKNGAFMRRYSPPPTRTTVHLCAGIRPTGWWYGMRRHRTGARIMLYPVGANKTANSFAGIRPWMPRRYSPMDATPVFARRGCICGIKRTTIVTTINAN